MQNLGPPAAEIVARNTVEVLDEIRSCPRSPMKIGSQDGVRASRYANMRRTRARRHRRFGQRIEREWN